MPRQWLAMETPISVQRIPTKWGRVGYRLEPKGRTILATLDLPETPIPTVRLRLRHPEMRKLAQVSSGIIARDQETITLPKGVHGRVPILARFA
jgi:hypothetical protein